MASQLQRASCLWRSSWTRCLLIIVSVPWMCHLTSAVWKLAVTIRCTEHRTCTLSETQPQLPSAYKLQKIHMRCTATVNIGVNPRRIWCSVGAALLAFRMEWQFAILDGTTNLANHELAMSIAQEQKGYSPHVWTYKEDNSQWLGDLHTDMSTRIYLFICSNYKTANDWT